MKVLKQNSYKIMIILMCICILTIGQRRESSAETIITQEENKILKVYELKVNKFIEASPKEKYDENKKYEDLL